MPVRPRRRYAALGYGWLAYLLALCTVAYAVGFLANAWVPKSVDSGPTVPLAEAVIVDLSLLSLFGIQHSGMARRRFKAWWTGFVPEPVERSTYVLLASASLIAVMWGWRPLPATVWELDAVAPLVWVGYLGGWFLMFAGVNMIDGDDLMGLRQVRAYAADRAAPPLGFQTPALYQFIRHPLVTGFLIAFWVTPRMTVGHLVFAAGMTAYVLIGVRLEERDLRSIFGDRYRQYQQEVPMFLPRPGRRVSPSLTDEDADSGGGE